MHILSLVMIYIGINIDTFIALLFIINQYKILTPLISVVASDVFLWVLGVILGKTITIVFPTWITGFMGFILLGLVFRRSDQQTVDNNHTGLIPIFLLCISLGGDNLAVYIPWAVNLSFLNFTVITTVFIICSIAMVLLAKIVIHFKPITRLLERYGKYCTKLVYLCAGIRIILSSKVINHLVSILI